MSIFERTYGVEIECIAPAGVTMHATAQAITAAGVSCQAMGYNHRIMPGVWKIVSDASVNSMGPGGSGMEIVSPPLSGEEGLRQIELVSRHLMSAGFTVNRTCGLHVHVDASRMSVATMRRLAILYAEGEGIIDSVMAPSRRANNNVYCRSIASASRHAINGAANAAGLASAIANGGRYGKVNFAAYFRYRTVEFRQHGGTVDYTKINAWVKFVLRLIKLSFSETAGAIEVSHYRARAGSKREMILRMLNEGCTRQQLLAATGWRKMSIRKVAQLAGVEIVKERRFSRVATYRSRPIEGQPSATPVVALPLTFDTLMTYLECDDAEVTFWKGRRDFFAAQAVNADHVNMAA